MTFALQDPAKHDDVAGLGNGFVGQFNLDDSGRIRVASNGVFDSPWGLAIAPSSFGSLAGDLLVGDFGDGTIGAVDLGADTFAGELLSGNGDPVGIGDLWALTVGNGVPAGSPQSIYFTSGVAQESSGLFGSLTPVPQVGIRHAAAWRDQLHGRADPSQSPRRGAT